MHKIKLRRRSLENPPRTEGPEGPIPKPLKFNSGVLPHKHPLLGNKETETVLAYAVFLGKRGKFLDLVLLSDYRRRVIVGYFDECPEDDKNLLIYLSSLLELDSHFL